MVITASEILQKVTSLNRMSDLDPNLFSEEGGYAEVLAKDLRGKLKATQLRKVFHAIKRIDIGLKGEKDDKPVDRTDLNRLLPELAYAKGRGLVPQEFYDLMKAILSRQRTQTVSDFRRTVEFLTAVLAYHKLYS